MHCLVLCIFSEGFLTSLTKTLQKHVPVRVASRDAQEENLEYSMKRVSVAYFWISFLVFTWIYEHLWCMSLEKLALLDLDFTLRSDKSV